MIGAVCLSAGFLQEEPCLTFSLTLIAKCFYSHVSDEKMVAGEAGPLTVDTSLVDEGVGLCTYISLAAMIPHIAPGVLPPAEQGLGKGICWLTPAMS
jgi:hypothetical protein